LASPRRLDDGAQRQEIGLFGDLIRLTTSPIRAVAFGVDDALFIPERLPGWLETRDIAFLAWNGRRSR
jgi:hypothetical protein